MFILDFLFKKYNKIPISIFLSYSSEDRVLAGKIKYILEHYWNFNVFLAHEDLEPSIEWEKEILRNLHNCEIFMPLISENFQKSNWADQESGIAFNKGKLVLSICNPGLPPYGFIRRYQAFFYHDSRDPFNQVSRVVEILETRDIFKKRIFEGIIVALENSQSFDMTRNLAKLLNSHFDSISKDHFKRIKIAIENNGQVKDEAYRFPSLLARLEQKFGR